MVDQKYSESDLMIMKADRLIKEALEIFKLGEKSMSPEERKVVKGKINTSLELLEGSVILDIKNGNFTKKTIVL